MRVAGGESRHAHRGSDRARDLKGAMAGTLCPPNASPLLIRTSQPLRYSTVTSCVRILSSPLRGGRNAVSRAPIPPFGLPGTAELTACKHLEVLPPRGRMPAVSHPPSSLGIVGAVSYLSPSYPSPASTLPVKKRPVGPFIRTHPCRGSVRRAHVPGNLDLGGPRRGRRLEISARSLEYPAMPRAAERRRGFGSITASRGGVRSSSLPGTLFG